MSDVNLEMIEGCPQGSVFFDIGANHGHYSTIMAAKAEIVYAFEPGPDNIESLLEAANLHDNIEVHKIALSNKNGTTKLMIHPGNPGGHSIHETLAGKQYKHTLEASVDVEVLTLDLWCQHNGITRVDGIKIDVEAHEKEVLEGAKDTLKKYHPLIALETHHFADLEGARNILLECGYEVETLSVDRGYLIKKST